VQKLFFCYNVWKHMKLQLPQNALLRQLVGAVMGSMVALVLYQAYEVAAPHLQAFLTSAPVSSAPAGYSREAREGRQDQVVLRAKQLLEGALQE
jgi:hypothetical protein